MFLQLSEAMNLHQDECYILNVTINLQTLCLDFIVLRVMAEKIIPHDVKKKLIEIANMISVSTIIISLSI